MDIDLPLQRKAITNVALPANIASPAVEPEESEVVVNVNASTTSPKHEAVEAVVNDSSEVVSV